MAGAAEAWPPVAGGVVPEAYDSLVAKLICWGNDRPEARARMLRALEEFHIDGIATTIPANIALLQSDSFVDGSHTTKTVETEGVLDALAADADSGEEDVLIVGGRGVRLWNPAMAPSAAAATRASGAHGELLAPMQGTILKVLALEGDAVDAGQPVVVLEAMKMETTIAAPRAGKVTEVRVVVGDTAASGQVLAVIE